MSETKATEEEPVGRSAGATERSDHPPEFREIGHDEFDPIGTLALIGIYFALLVLLWLFVYFVEFLDNGPTVVGSIATVVGLA